MSRTCTSSQFRTRNKRVKSTGRRPPNHSPISTSRRSNANLCSILDLLHGEPTGNLGSPERRLSTQLRKFRLDGGRPASDWVLPFDLYGFDH